MIHGFDGGDRPSGPPPPLAANSLSSGAHPSVISSQDEPFSDCFFFFLYQGRPPYLRLHGPNQWPSPEAAPEFQETLTEFMRHLRVLAETLMAAMALSLGLPRDYFDATFAGKPHIRMKIINYPPHD